MKKLLFLAFIALCCTHINTSCKKETVVEKIVYQDTTSRRMFLLNFIALEQTPTKSRVILQYFDKDANINNSYDNTLFNVNTATLEDNYSDGSEKAVFDSVNITDYYRVTTVSRPSNDTIKVIFRIGTMGDVDIKTE